jgi:predicted ester cyclase
MLKLSLAFAALAFIAAPALAQDCSKTTEGTAPLAQFPAVRAFYDSMTLGDAGLVDCAVGPDWLNNPSAPDTPKGPDGFKPSVGGIRAVFSQYSFATQDVVATGDKVVVRSLVTAVQVAPFLGVAPGETPVTFQTIDIHQLGADGKLAQSWHVEDWMSFLFQRGALPLKAE